MRLTARCVTVHTPHTCLVCICYLGLRITHTPPLTARRKHLLPASVMFHRGIASGVGLVARVEVAAAWVARQQTRIDIKMARWRITLAQK